MKRTFIVILLICVCVPIIAQNKNAIPYDNDADSNQTSTISLAIPTQMFFKNNEYTRKIAYGYTLGGFRTIPQVEYKLNSFLFISAGINLLRYWGADKYGNYNFVSVPYYSDTNAQSQFHWKPYLRIVWQVNNRLKFVAGNIETQHYHYLPIPLYNRELAYTSDGEEGLQLLYNGKYWTNDAWVNWQNFNFYNDIDRESFELGISGYANTSQEHKIVGLLNYAFIWHHNGGELDTISTLDLDHWSNGRIGGEVKINDIFNKNLDLTFAIDYLFAKDMKNSTWAFKSGYAYFPTIKLNGNNWQTTLGYYDSKKMMTFYGTNFFSNLAQRQSNVVYPHNQMLYASIDYCLNMNGNSNKFLSNYYMTLVGEFFYKLDTENSIEKESNTLSFGLGVVLTAKPKFKLYKFKNLN